MDPIFPLVIISAIAGAATLGWRATRSRRLHGETRVAWKIICYRCTYLHRRAVPDCEECRAAGMMPLSKYQALGGGTGFWLDPDGPLVSSLCAGEWQPSDDAANRPQGRRHAPIFDFDFPVTWTPLDRGGELSIHRHVGRSDYLALLAQMEKLRLIVPGSVACAEPIVRRPDGIPGFRAPGAVVLTEARFQFLVPGRLVPSSTEGHFHFYLETVMGWTDYLRLMRAMVAAGLLEKKWVDMSERRSMAMLRKPGVKKGEGPIGHWSS